MLGSSVVVFSSIAGASIFSTLHESNSFFWKVTAGVISLSAGVLASLQAFLNLSTKSEEHLVIAKNLTILKREVEEAIKLVSDVDQLKEFNGNTRVKWKEIIIDAPIVGETIFKNTKIEEEEEERNKVKERNEGK